MTTYYKLLQINQNASEADIRKAYHKLALEYHPDKNPTGAETFKEIQKAYETLSDPEKRRIYDLTLPSSDKSTAEKQTAPKEDKQHNNASTIRTIDQLTISEAKQLFNLLLDLSLYVRKQYRENQAILMSLSSPKETFNFDLKNGAIQFVARPLIAGRLLPSTHFHERPQQGYLCVIKNNTYHNKNKHADKYVQGWRMDNAKTYPYIAPEAWECILESSYKGGRIDSEHRLHTYSANIEMSTYYLGYLLNNISNKFSHLLNKTQHFQLSALFKQSLNPNPLYRISLDDLLQSISRISLLGVKPEDRLSLIEELSEKEAWNPSTSDQFMVDQLQVQREQAQLIKAMAEEIKTLKTALASSQNQSTGPAFFK